MFNLKKTTQAVAGQAKQNFAEPVTVAEIHNAFDTAVDELINKAINIAARDEEKYNILSDMGFSNASPVKKISQQMEERKTQKQVSKWTSYYREHYPLNKFITQELVESVCKKYSLVLGEAISYIGDVPNKNANEINRFKLRTEDFSYYICQWHVKSDKFGSGYAPVNFKEDGSVWGYKYTPAGAGVTSFIKHEEDKNCSYKPPFRICAPQKDFNMEGSKIASDGFSIEPEDPVVLQPVSGGYLIVSKWGDEASDKDLVNQIEN